MNDYTYKDTLFLVLIFAIGTLFGILVYALLSPSRVTVAHDLVRMERECVHYRADVKELLLENRRLTRIVGEMEDALRPMFQEVQ